MIQIHGRCVEMSPANSPFFLDTKYGGGSNWLASAAFS